jgi:hypothetical protein
MRMTRLFFIPFPLAVLLSLSACSTSSRPDKGSVISIPKAGFQCLPVPSTWMEPGSVFSVDNEGTSYRLGKVTDIVVSPPGPAGFPVYEATSNFKVGFLLTTLAALTKATGWEAQVGANASNNVTVTATYERPQLALTEGQPEAAAIAWFKAMQYRIEPNHRYYLVREALLADNAAYELKRDDLAKINGEASVKNMVNGKLDVFQKAGTSNYVLKASFPAMLNVCIKPRELKILAVGSGGNQTLQVTNVVEPIKVERVKLQE